MRRRSISMSLFISMMILIALKALLNASPAASNRRAIAPDAAAIFKAKCAKCHGQDGKGTAEYKEEGQKDFTDAGWQKTRTDAQLTESITNGKGDFMPAWKGKLSAEEIKALVAYVRSFAKKK
ncbi:MAG: c-type cytochrome [Acidobacteria bacterium]|nr:c-type cytochrome [Acidobacteriota bacterium]